jgi:phage gp45-like
MHDAVRTMLRRGAIVAADDSGPQQLLTLSGLASEQLKKIVKLQQFGISSNAPVGANGLIAALGGRSDRAMFIGGEDPASRPRSTPIGGTTIYDAYGQALSFVQNNVRLVCANFTIQASGKIVLQGPVYAGSASATQPVKLANNQPATMLFAV